MKWHRCKVPFYRRNLSFCWLYPVVLFTVICLLPWWDGSKGGLIHDAWPLPFATAYVSQFPGWPTLLLIHVLVTLLLSTSVIGLHVWIGSRLQSKSSAASAREEPR